MNIFHILSLSMMNSKYNTIIKDLVLIGGGHAHAVVLKKLGMNPIPGIQVTLVARDIETPYSGMLPGYIAGCYDKDECYIDLNKLSRFANARLIHSSAMKLDTIEKKVYCDDGRPPIRYDVLSIDIGITPSTISTNLNSNVNITPVKPIDRFGSRWDQILSRIQNKSFEDTKDSSQRIPIKIAIVGGGAAGVELAFSVYHRLKKDFDQDVATIMLITRGNTLMSSHGRSTQENVTRELEEKGIEIILNAEIVDATITEKNPPIKRNLVATDGRIFEFDEAIWCTKAQGQSWLKESGLDTTEENFIKVQLTLESVNVKDVFAAGDIAHLVDNPKPKAGVFAVRAGEHLVENLQRRFHHQPLELWIPQQEFLSIIGTGDNYAIASKGGVTTVGPEMWKLKVNLDKTWMNNLHELPDMEKMMAKKTERQSQNEKSLLEISKESSQSTKDMLFKPKMRCGGCGSKVGSQILTRALSQVQKYHGFTRSEVVNRTGDDAALIKPPASTMGCPNPLLVQTIDYIKTCSSDPYVFGKVAAIHALSDIYAMNGTPISALALCVLPLADEEIIVERLEQLLAGVMTALREENCALVGGHTSEGADLAIGLSITGVTNTDQVLYKGPLRVGDLLVLTKGIGTGVILAADMALKAKAAWVSEAYRSAMQSNRTAANLLSRFKASACTDVTGFGLLGHLLEMIKFDDEIKSLEMGKKNIGVELFLNSIPLLNGAIECVKLGVESSLTPQNIRCARAVKNGSEFTTSDIYPLLFDPQTSGGLLACVHEDNVNDLLSSLREAGYDRSVVIGRVVEIDSIDRENETFVTIE